MPFRPEIRLSDADAFNARFAHARFSECATWPERNIRSQARHRFRRLLGGSARRVPLRNYCGNPLSGATSSGSTHPVIGNLRRDGKGVPHREKISYISFESSFFLKRHFREQCWGDFLSGSGELGCASKTCQYPASAIFVDNL